MARTIVIDPGHGKGKDKPDCGAVGYSTKTYESQNVMNTANILKAKLEKEGFKVLLTRADDNTYPSWNTRLSICNKGDLIISLHNNAFSDVKAHGYETLVATSAPTETLDIAECVHKAMVNATGLTDRGIKKRNDLAVLCQTTPNALLLELGFISNETEEKLLNDSQWQSTICDALTKAICEFYKVTYTQTKPSITHTVTVIPQTIIANNLKIEGINTVNISGSTYIKFRDLAKLSERVNIDYKNGVPVINL